VVISQHFDFDIASRLTGYTHSADGLVSYNYDNLDQLIDATGGTVPDESFNFDDNGNRVDAAPAGQYNRLTDDGTYTYQYDAEGNLTRRTAADGSYRQFAWDHRNRLVSVIDHAPDDSVTQQVDHTYDPFNRWIATTVDDDGDGPAAAVTTRYVYDGNQIILEQNESGEVRHRYLWGPAVDQLLASEDFDPAQPAVPGELTWSLSDHLGTIRDLVDSQGNQIDHITYGAFGNITAATVDFLFRFTGRPLDENTGLQNNLNRWYDPETGRWLSEDPIGFAAGDANLFRYVGNSVTNAGDPTGLVGPVDTGPFVRSLDSLESFETRVRMSEEIIDEADDIRREVTASVESPRAFGNVLNDGRRGLGTGGKATVNASATFLAQTVTLGVRDAPVMVFEFDRFDREAGGEFSMQLSTTAMHVGFAAASGKLGVDVINKGGRAAIAGGALIGREVAEGGVMGAQAVGDIRENGVNVNNAIKLSTAVLGPVGALSEIPGALRKSTSTFGRIPTDPIDEMGETIARSGQGLPPLPGASGSRFPGPCFIEGTLIGCEVLDVDDRSEVAQAKEDSDPNWTTLFMVSAAGVFVWGSHYRSRAHRQATARKNESIDALFASSSDFE